VLFSKVSIKRNFWNAQSFNKAIKTGRREVLFDKVFLHVFFLLKLRKEILLNKKLRVELLNEDFLTFMNTCISKSFKHHIKIFNKLNDVFLLNFIGKGFWEPGNYLEDDKVVLMVVWYSNFEKLDEVLVVRVVEVSKIQDLLVKFVVSYFLQKHLLAIYILVYFELLIKCAIFGVKLMDRGLERFRREKFWLFFFYVLLWNCL
jgi:hypothetical protein